MTLQGPQIMVNIKSKELFQNLQREQSNGTEANPINKLSQIIQLHLDH